MNGPAVTPSPLEQPARPAPPAGASVEGPKGIGGWLLLPLLGLVMSVVLIARNLLELNGLRGADEWVSRTAPGSVSSATASSLWTPYLNVSFAVGGLLVLFAAVLIVAFVFRSRRLPAGIVGFYIALVVAAGVDVVFFSLLPGGGLTPDSLRGAWTQLVRALVSGAIWSLYFSMSKRVRNTFVR
jgi:hypothetical protein